VDLVNAPITVIQNPASGRGKRKPEWEAARERLRAAGAIFLDTEAPGHAQALATKAAELGGTVVAAGGDGTLCEVLNGMLGSAATLAVLPLGTGNDFARSIALGTDLSLAVTTAIEGTPHYVDVYHWSCDGRQGYGLNVGGCGFDAVVADRINQGYRWLRGTQAYVAAVVESLYRYRPASLCIDVDGVREETTAMLCSVANTPSYGGGMRVAPDARIDDGLLDVVVVRGTGRVEFLRAFPRVFNGTHTTHPKVHITRGRSITIDSTPPLPVLVDGEIVGMSPVTFEVVPQAIRVMLPAGGKDSVPRPAVL